MTRKRPPAQNFGTTNATGAPSDHFYMTLVMLTLLALVCETPGPLYKKWPTHWRSEPRDSLQRPNVSPSVTLQTAHTLLTFRLPAQDPRHACAPCRWHSQHHIRQQLGAARLGGSGRGLRLVGVVLGHRVVVNEPILFCYLLLVLPPFHSIHPPPPLSCPSSCPCGPSCSHPSPIPARCMRWRRTLGCRPEQHSAEMHQRHSTGVAGTMTAQPRPGPGPHWLRMLLLLVLLLPLLGCCCWW